MKDASEAQKDSDMLFSVFRPFQNEHSLSQRKKISTNVGEGSDMMFLEFFFFQNLNILAVDKKGAQKTQIT